MLHPSVVANIVLAMLSPITMRAKHRRPLFNQLPAGRDFRNEPKKRSTDCEQRTSCKTLKRKVNAYVRKCTRSFGLIAQVFNCRVITAFVEIYRSETIKQILDMIFTAIRSKFSLLSHVPATSTTLFALSL